MKLVKFIILGLLIALMLFLYIMNHHYKDVIKSQLKEVGLVKEMVFIESYYGGTFDISTEVIFLDTIRKGVPLSSGINGKPKLVFRFTDLNCETCIKAILPTLKSVLNRIGVDNIILIVSYKGINYARLFCRDENLNLPIYSVPYNINNNGVEKLNSPYFFILFPNSQGKNTFVPSEGLPELTLQYLNRIEALVK